MLDASVLGFCSLRGGGGGGGVGGRMGTIVSLFWVGGCLNGTVAVQGGEML